MFIILFIHLSSTYFIKVHAKSKKQEVDTFIQQLLDSEKFDEFADKIAMKAVERINDNREAEKQLRTDFEPIDETHRSAASKKKKGKTEKLSSHNLTIDDEKTTVISLKYKRFTQNILEDYAMNEDTNDTIKTTVQNNNETNAAESDEGIAKKSSESDTKKTELKIKTNNNDNGNVKKTVNTKKTTKQRIKNYDASMADKATKVKDSKDDVGEELTNTKKSTENGHSQDDDEDNNDLSNEVVVNTKKLVELQKTDDEDESDFVKKGNNKKSTDSDVKVQRKDDEDVNDDVASREQEQNDESSAGGSRTQQSYKNNKSKTNKKHRVDRANTDADDKSGDKYENDDENNVLKDNGNVDAEEDKEKLQSTEERLNNNKILVRREGNTLYAQNLEEYEEYRDQLAAGAKKHSVD